MYLRELAIVYFFRDLSFKRKTKLHIFIILSNPIEDDSYDTDVTESNSNFILVTESILDPAVESSNCVSILSKLTSGNSK